jgi:hypothetical protein
MAGVKGKSGAPGRKKEKAHNPAGRPIGCKNKITYESKKILTDIFKDNADILIEDIKAIKEPHIRANVLLKIASLITPRPLNEEEKDANFVASEIIKRLFIKNEA